MTGAKPFEISKEEVEQAFLEVKASKGAPGVDGVSIKEYEANLKNNLYKLWNRMSSGSYFPKPVKGVEIPKKSGGKRLLGIPTVNDRVAQAVVKNRLEVIVEPLFVDESFGYRPNKSATDAVGAARSACFEHPWVIEFDIKGLFDHIDHDLLMRAVAHHAKEKWVLLYVERFLTMPIAMPDGEVQARTEGTPQGGVISPVLANLFMHYAFDLWMKRTYPGKAFERYADDGLIHCDSESEAKAVLENLDARMRECKLELHPDKTRIVYCRSNKFSGHHENETFDFLGYTFKTRWNKIEDRFRLGFSPAVSEQAKKSFRKKVKEVCHNATSWKLQWLADKLNPIIRGWCNYFGAYRKSEMDKELYYVNCTLLCWVRRNRKRVGRRRGSAWRYLCTVAKYNSELFYHWTLGKLPMV